MKIPLEIVETSETYGITNSYAEWEKHLQTNMTGTATVRNMESVSVFANKIGKFMLGRAVLESGKILKCNAISVPKLEDVNPDTIYALLDVCTLPSGDTLVQAVFKE